MRVCVIIPAWNAERTLARALASVQAQSHGDLEIIVVDDGSSDGTLALARAIAADDRRITVLTQANAGVAAARNAALARTEAPLTAWLDADDIWHPAKIARQIATCRAAPEAPSLVYTGYRLIDADDRIIPNFRTLADVSGHTLCRQIATNFFGNVSSVMAPTELARRFGGHDPRLRAWGIEGAEDLLLQLQLAAIGPVACCREALVGYRMHPHNMSHGHARAARSNLRAVDMAAAAAGDVPGWVVRLGRARTAGYALHMLRAGDTGDALALLGRLMRRQPVYTLLTLALIAQWQLRAALNPAAGADPETGRPFAEADPATVPWRGAMILSRWHDRALDRADAARRAPGVRLVSPCRAPAPATVTGAVPAAGGVADAACGDG